MAYFGGVVKGAAGGAGIGFGLGGPIGAGIGALVGGISGLFEDSPEEIAQRRLQQTLESIRKRKIQALKEGTTELSRMIGTQSAGGRKAAAQRAGALGKSSDVEAFVNPVEGKIAEAGSSAFNRMQTDINRNYDMMAANAEMEYAKSPASPGPTDYLLPLGEAAFTFAMNKSFKTPEDTKPWEPPKLDTTTGLASTRHEDYSTSYMHRGRGW